MLVRFTKCWRNYQPDEVAGFEPDIAESLISGGVAVAEDDSAAAPRGRKANAQADAAAKGN
jgi:hypothetical protein